MNNLYCLISGCIGFVLGVLMTLLATKQLTISIKFNSSKDGSIKHNHKSKLSIKSDSNKQLENVDKLILFVKSGKSFPFYLKPDVIEGLKEIAKNDNYRTALDSETIKNIEAIYFRLQKANKNNKIVTTTAGGGFESPKYWEGTEEEYIKALEDGMIDENTEVNILIDEANYHGSWLQHTADGSVEEYMD